METIIKALLLLKDILCLITFHLIQVQQVKWKLEMKIPYINYGIEWNDEFYPSEIKERCVRKGHTVDIDENKNDYANEDNIRIVTNL